MSSEPLLQQSLGVPEDPLKKISTTAVAGTPQAASEASSRRVSQVYKKRASLAKSIGFPDETKQEKEDIDDRASMKSENHVGELHAIKAQTMHNVIEDVHDKDGVLRKVVFLTNGQAKIITESALSLRLLVETLDMPEPKLLINLIPSFDGSELIYDGHFTGNSGLPPGLEGIRLDVKPPDKHVSTWESKADYYKVERKLSEFMKDVVIPLAVETNAVVLCDAAYGQCLLAQVFGRMVGLRRAEWGAKLPFTVIGACSAMPLLYHNPDEDANWQYIRAHCKQWRERNPRMEQLMEVNAGWGFSTDLDPNVSAYLLFDSISESRGGSIGILGPGNLLISALTNHFKERIPCIGIKTGMSWKEKAGQRFQTGLSVVVDLLSAGIPVIGLDLRPRRDFKPEDTKGAELIQRAKDAWCATADKLDKQHFPDVLDVCALTFFHPVLGGHLGGADSGKEKQMMPLYKAIEKEEESLQRGRKKKLQLRQSSIRSSKKEEGPHNLDMEDTAAADVVNTEFEERTDLDGVIEWIAHQYYERCWNNLPEEDRPKDSDYEEHYGDFIQNWLVQAKAIMSNPDFYCVNVENIDEAQQRMRELVKLDRLPAKNSFEGLRLLRRLWNHHDICAYHAGRYKFTSKISYFLQLFFQIALVICGVLNHGNIGAKPSGYRGAVPFVISTFASAIITINALVNPMKRWRQLRGSALTLESLCWKYRTRVDEFAIQPQTPSAPEIALSDSMRSFLDELVSGTDLDSSDLGRTYHNSVYKHFQIEPEESETWPGGDDHQSPCKPADYIQLRILPAKEFYSGRIAPYSWWRYWWMFLGLLCTACSSLLSFLGLTMYLGIPSAVANALFAWSEFADINRKMERYNNVVRKLEKLLIWWDGIGEVEKASSANIRKLVLNAESLIAGEYQAWQSISSSGSVDEADVSLDVSASASISK